ncbi:DUF1450 domain-containing protein [Brevibacillus migulae]|uniref:DUF1450 domain-containing protein n=1 Tax=Brevibacillus migulae TaxID=1644114 RepID=UPI00106DF431|nr:DUF1450 domain-containing protein [Brevibacillus migulae]
MEKISFCRKNAGYTKPLYKFLQTHLKGIKIKRKDCLGACGACQKKPFARVDGEVVKCKTADELYQEIQKHLAKEWKHFRKK